MQIFDLFFNAGSALVVIHTKSNLNGIFLSIFAFLLCTRTYTVYRMEQYVDQRAAGRNLLCGKWCYFVFLTGVSVRRVWL